jgi:uncharacterized protein
MDTSPSLDGSTLCKGCGLCCRGVLHSGVWLREVELPLARELGLEVEPIGPDAALSPERTHIFALPCPCLAGTTCSAYERRPVECRTYHCKLLYRYLEGEITLAHAQLQVRKMEAALDSLEVHMGPRAANQPVWQWIEVWRNSAKVETSDEARRACADTMLQIAVLAILMDHQFGLSLSSRGASSKT